MVAVWLLAISSDVRKVIIDAYDMMEQERHVVLEDAISVSVTYQDILRLHPMKPIFWTGPSKGWLVENGVLTLYSQQKNAPA